MSGATKTRDELQSEVEALRTHVAQLERAEEELKERENYFRLFSLSTSDCFWNWDMVAGTVARSSGFDRVFGYKEQDILPGIKWWAERIHPEDKKRVWETFNAAVAGEQSICDYEYRFRCRDNSYSVVDDHVCLIRDATGKVVRSLGAMHDITERKRADKEHTRLVTAIEQAAETVVIADLDGTILYVNPAFERTTGYTREETIGQNTRFLKSGEHDESFYKNMWDTITRGDVWSGRFTNKTKDGRFYEEVATISPVRDEFGQIVNFVAVKQDVTEQMRVEEELRLRQTELAHMARLSLMGEMASGLAHELNQPLAAIVNYSRNCIQRIRSGTPEPQKLVAALEKSIVQAERGSEIINRVRGFVRKQKPHRSTTDINQVILETVSMLEYEVRQSGIPTHLDLAEDLPSVLVDRVELQQVVLNLARNGLESMEDSKPSKSGLTITTTTRADGGIGVEVADRGHGLPPDGSERLFEPFFTTKSGGLGMGLAICRTIVEAHGGRLWALPNADRGATFRFVIPTGGVPNGSADS